MPDEYLQIQQMFVQQFDDIDNDDIEALNVSLYVATKFNTYLQNVRQDRYPTEDDDEASYIIGTIKSGIEDLFYIANLNHRLIDGIQSELSLEKISAFSDFKNRYAEVYASLSRTDTHLQMRFRNLVDLGKMQLIFVALALM